MFSPSWASIDLQACKRKDWKPPRAAATAHSSALSLPAQANTCWWRKKLCPSEWCMVRCYDHHNLCSLWYQWFNSLTAWSYIKQFSSASRSAINYFPPFIFPHFPPFLDQNCPFHSYTSSWIKGEKRTKLANPSTFVFRSARTLPCSRSELCFYFAQFLIILHR